MDTLKTLPEYEQNSNLHLKKLYEFKVDVLKRYVGGDQALLLDGIDRKIREVKNKIKTLEMRDK